jgi:hypothetical protein
MPFKDPEKRIAYEKQRLLNPVRIAYNKKKCKERYHKNPEWYANYRKEYSANNRQALRDYQENLRHTLREQALEVLGSKCVKCGSIDKRFFHIDHINGGGCREKRLAGTNQTNYKKILANPKDYQILCVEDNWLKRYENNEFTKRTANGRTDKRLQRYHDRKQKAFDVLGGKCVQCGKSDPRLLQIDHINGNGHLEQKKIGITGIRSKILAGQTEGYQILCVKDNWLKRIENKEVNKKKPKL